MPDRARHLFNVPVNERAGVIIDAISGLFQTVFPGRIRAIYLIGSRGEGSAASISDIDGSIIFQDAFVDEAERARAEEVLAQCRRLSPLRLDFALLAEDDEKLQSGIDVRLKLSSELVYGKDIRDALPLPAIEAYQSYLRAWVVPFLAAIHDVKQPAYPLHYPDADDAFFGYTRKRALPWYPPQVTAGTKELVATICWVASARLAFEAGQYVGSRAHCLQLCAQHLPQPQADFVQQSYTKCKREWDYQIPTDKGQQRELRQICKDALPFFNSYLQRYGSSTNES